MKRLTLSILCLTTLACSALANDDNATPAAPDNSGRNVRDRGETKTSGDQAENSDDIQTTAAIRRALMDDDSLSMTAKNVKIITADGMVTLRGPVMSAAEKAKIAELAQKAAPKAKVTDQLEVKADSE